MESSSGAPTPLDEAWMTPGWIGESFIVYAASALGEAFFFFFFFVAMSDGRE